jgi:CDP-diacylglycerol--glycerol-3-phosphate 3-phosphatidyltransferase
VIVTREILVSGLREYLGTVKLAVTRLAKGKTTAQMLAIGLLFLAASLAEDPAGSLVGTMIGGTGALLLWVAATLTLVTGWDYLRKSLPHLREA